MSTGLFLILLSEFFLQQDGVRVAGCGMRDTGCGMCVACAVLRIMGFEVKIAVN